MNFTSTLIYGIYQCKWDQFASMHGKTPDSYSLRKILMVWRYSQIFYPEQIFPVCARTIICWCIQVNGLPLHFGETTLVHWHYCLKTIRLWCHTILIGPSVFGDCTQMVKHWPIRPSDFALTISLWSLYMCIWTLHLKYKILDNIH